jgi:hypothetical protein
LSINFREYDEITEIHIPPYCIMHDENFNNKFISMQNLIKCIVPDDITNIDNTFKNCVNFAGPISCDANVITMNNTYYNCSNCQGPNSNNPFS